MFRLLLICHRARAGTMQSNKFEGKEFMIINMNNEGIFPMFKKLTAFVILAAVALSGCSAKKKNEKLQVYASFYAMYDFAREIGGDKADVYNMCPTGSEPHDYEPTPSDIARLSEGDVFVYNGLGMEPWTDDIVSSLGGTELIILRTSDRLTDTADIKDPHVWLDPENAYTQMQAIAEAFAEADPENAAYYTENAAQCKKKIDTLINDYTTAREEFSSSVIITSHEAYSGLCGAFDLTQMGINGVENSGDPTPARMAEIESYIKENDVKYIFDEPLSSGKVTAAVAADTGCAVLRLDPFEGNTENKDYFTVMYENLDSLKTALN